MKGCIYAAKQRVPLCLEAADSARLAEEATLTKPERLCAIRIGLIGCPRSAANAMGSQRGEVIKGRGC